MLRPMSRQRLLLGAIALVLAAPAAAQTGKGTLFSRLDSDGDNVISKEEARQAAAERFAGLDADDDGMLSKDEWLTLSDDRFARFDLNGDGQITLKEAQEVRQARRERRQAE